MNCKFMRFLFSFAVIHLVLVIPAYFVIAWHAGERLEIELTTEKPLTVQILNGQQDLNGGVVRRASVLAGVSHEVVEIYSVDGFRNELWRVQFRPEGNEGTFIVHSIRVRNPLMFHKKLDLNRFMQHPSLGEHFSLTEQEELQGKCEDKELLLKCSAEELWRMDYGFDRALYCILFLMEVLLALLSVGALRIKCSGQNLVIQSLSLAFLAASFFTILLPVQSYLVNRSIFDFTLGTLLKTQGMVCVATTAYLYVSLLMAGKCWGRFLHCIVFSVVLYAYLETGIMAIGSATLDGDLMHFVNPGKRVLDAIVLACAFVIPLCFYRQVREFLHWPIFAVLILCLASVLDIKVEEKKGRAQGGISCFAPEIDVVKSAHFAYDRNVLVFIVDSVASDVAQEVLAKYPELGTAYNGFVAFTNHVGMYPHTAGGIPSIMTGSFADCDFNSEQYGVQIYGKKSFVYPYVTAGNPVYVVPGMFRFGCTNRRISYTSANAHESECIFPLFARTAEMPGMNLLEIIRFRLTPFRLKTRYLSVYYRGSGTYYDLKNEVVLYPMLLDIPVEQIAGPTLHVYYSQGVHAPVSFDEEGRTLKCPSDRFDDLVNAGAFVFKKLAEILDSMRIKRVYDDSLIVICADHGNGHNKETRRQGRPARSDPMLWVKVPHADAPFTCCSNLTSHTKIAEVVKAAQTKELNIQEVRTILTVDSAMYFDSKKMWVIEPGTQARLAE